MLSAGIRMAVKPIKKSMFLQEFEMRNSRHQEQIKTIFVAKALQILKTPPFGYSDRICNEVAHDIIEKGAKLQTNSVVEDDDDHEMFVLNNMGDTFQGMQMSTLLFLSVDGQDHSAEEELVKKNFPMPPQPRYNVKRESVKTLPECLEKLKPFIIYVAPRSFSATIVVMGELTEDGIKFGNGATIPREILEKQAAKMLEESEENSPLALDMVFLDKNTVHVTSMPRSVPGVHKDTTPTRVILTED